jgi:hypothetical protein
VMHLFQMLEEALTVLLFADSSEIGRSSKIIKNTVSLVCLLLSDKARAK